MSRKHESDWFIVSMPLGLGWVLQLETVHSSVQRSYNVGSELPRPRHTLMATEADFSVDLQDIRLEFPADRGSHVAIIRAPDISSGVGSFTQGRCDPEQSGRFEGGRQIFGNISSHVYVSVCGLARGTADTVASNWRGPPQRRLCHDYDPRRLSHHRQS